jgi:hypothetical protein
MIADSASSFIPVHVNMTSAPQSDFGLPSCSGSSLQKNDVTYISPSMALEQNGCVQPCGWRRQCMTVCRAYYSAITGAGSRDAFANGTLGQGRSCSWLHNGSCWQPVCTPRSSQCGPELRGRTTGDDRSCSQCRRAFVCVAGFVSLGSP